MDTPFKYLSLATGIGGLDLGVELAIDNARCVCAVEVEASCVQILAEAMETGTLCPAPIWTNIKSFAGRPWRGKVDCVIVGYPCQPFSIAGKRRGEKDPRHLWPEVIRVLREVRPQFAYLENVAGHLRLGFDQVLYTLDEIGYNAEWTTLSAADVGASHGRNRLFILAYAKRLAERIKDDKTDTFAKTGAAGGIFVSEDGELGNADSALCQGCGKTGFKSSRSFIEGKASRRTGHTIPPRTFPPRPDELDEWRVVLETHPEICPYEETESTFHGMAYGATPWSGSIRMLGNAVVPIQAALAFIHLWDRIPLERRTT